QNTQSAQIRSQFVLYKVAVLTKCITVAQRILI
ncbi:MAG: hypothetical protein ACI959_001488, partial [Limisphaerales bacterium]